MMETILLWVCAFALAEMVEPPNYGPLSAQKRATSGLLLAVLLTLAAYGVVCELWELVVWLIK